MRKAILIAAALLLSLSAGAATIDAGVWYQTSSTAGDCAGCKVTVSYEAPHLLKFEASNGWVGFFYYDARLDEYSGFLELTGVPMRGMENWKGHIFQAVAVKDAMTLTLSADAGDYRFIATYRME